MSRDTPSFILPDILNNQVGHFLVGLAASVDDKVVVAGIVARGAGKLLDVVLAHLIHILDNLRCFLGAEASLVDDALYALLHGRGDEDVQTIGMILEDKEAAATGYHARTCLGHVLQDFYLSLKDVASIEQVGLVDDGRGVFLDETQHAQETNG